jgi:imidazolonepropionase-like amidohydrolase
VRDHSKDHAVAVATPGDTLTALPIHHFAGRHWVRSVEHGNLISEETARLIAEAGAYLVPTLVTYEALSEEGLRYGVPEENIRKIDEARASGIRALRYA